MLEFLFWYILFLLKKINILYFSFPPWHALGSYLGMNYEQEQYEYWNDLQRLQLASDLVPSGRNFGSASWFSWRWFMDVCVVVVSITISGRHCLLFGSEIKELNYCGIMSEFKNRIGWINFFASFVDKYSKKY